MVIVQVNGIKVPLFDVPRHRLADSGKEGETKLWIIGVDGVGIRPTQLPLIPEVDHLLSIREDVLIDLKVKGVIGNGNRQAQIQLG